MPRLVRSVTGAADGKAAQRARAARAEDTRTEDDQVSAPRRFGVALLEPPPGNTGVQVATKTIRSTHRVDPPPTPRSDIPQCVANTSDGTRCRAVPKRGHDKCGLHLLGLGGAR